MAFIKTHSRTLFYPLSPSPSTILLEDIVYSLARQCRFTGHPDFQYTVGQHSVLVARAVRDLGGTEEEQYAGLMHDTPETYLGDVARPIKSLLRGYAEMEDIVARAIARKFKVRYPWPPIVKEVDVRLCVNEGNMLMGGTHDWKKPVPKPLPGIVIRPWSTVRTQREFLNDFHALSKGRYHA